MKKVDQQKNNRLSLLQPVPALAGAGQPDRLNSPVVFMTASGQGPKKVIRVERRRRAEPPPEGPQRAETPQRRERAGAGAPPSYGGEGGGGPQLPFPSGGKPGIPLRGPQLIVVLVILVAVVCFFGISQLLGGGGLPDLSAEQPGFPAEPSEPFAILPVETSEFELPTQPPLAPPAAARRTPTSASQAVATGDQTWLVMLYQDADDKVLEQDIYVDLNEAEKVGSGDRLNIVAQIDRYRAGFQGDGDWTSARRFFVTQDDDLQRVRSEQVADLGEPNMADAGSLVDFVEWAVGAYPAERYVLILSDHGMGWPGGWSDSSTSRGGNPSIPLEAKLGDQIYLEELDQALGQIQQQTGIDKFDLIGLDACLMSQIEVFTTLEPYARYAVASQEVEPALGWAYTGFLGELKQNPDISTADLSKLIVQTYIEDDQRIVDDQARLDLLRQGGGMSGLFGLFGDISPQALASQMGQESTLTAVDLAEIPAFNAELNRFAYTLQGTSQPLVARARAYAQSFTSIFGPQVPPSYIDLGSFARLLQNESDSQEVVQGAQNLLAALGNTVIAEKHGPKKTGATGLAIYFPNSQLYRTPEAGARSYTAIARRFAQTSLWDDFLAFHYAGKIFEPQAVTAVVPGTGVQIRGPGEGQIQLSPISASSQTAAPGRPVELSTDISGQNVGYAYLFVGFYDRGSNSIFVADMDYLESSDTRSAGGVYYPDWGLDPEFTLAFEWDPVVFAIDDGQQRVTALFKPQSYGATFEQAVYTVDGVYTFADGGETRNARLIFSNGVLRQVVSFSGEAETGAPREIIPSTGDQFTIQERWLDLDSSGAVSQTAYQDGRTITFGNQTFKWVQLDAAAGDYVVGFIIEDLDGNAYEVYTQITVQ